jgi:hypothetical protein
MNGSNRPLRAIRATPADGRVDEKADLRTELLHVRAHHSRDSAEPPWNMPVEPLLCTYSPLRGNRRLSQFVEEDAGGL